ncbi:hypothetical protein HGRIS_002170 [Hohenbuehelia grisea]|uniref:PH domain-containing protein n=1 Tax=Hohenbuehelia grisea TaxID=104357 RepID=A0ABR3JKT1_9AGAR
MARPNHIQGRLFSPPSGDRMKDSILRESGMGWNSPSSNDSNSGSSNYITSPLRIAKRDSPNLRPRRQADGTELARRTSSSYTHVRKNNLVSKSPFKSQIPTPSTPSRSNAVAFPSPRRVSGEKRPRPPSMHDQAEVENERPFSYKRERTQSKTFQGLLQKEPVSKSPFKKSHASEDDALPPPPPPVRVLSDNIPNIHSSPAPRALPFIPADARTFVPAKPTTPSGSPTRSSLVSRRLHGPRVAGKRERRKTVTFDERCDVLEFDRQEGESDAFMSDDDEHLGHEDEEDDPFFLPLQQQHDEAVIDSHADVEHQDGDRLNDDGDYIIEARPGVDSLIHLDDSYESIALSDATNSSAGYTLDPDSSITGLVDEMFSHAQAAANLPTPVPKFRTSTPPASPGLPVDLETEDGVPLGRSHHRERQLRYRHEQQAFPSPPQPSKLYEVAELDQASENPLSLSMRAHSSPVAPSTPPRRNPVSPSSLSEGPLGRSTHMERVRAARAEEEQEEYDVAMLPASPSPMKMAPPRSSDSERFERLIPEFKLPPGTVCDSNSVDIDAADPFALPSLKNEPLPSSEESMDPANLSIGHSEVSLNGLDSDADADSADDAKNEPIDDGSKSEAFLDEGDSGDLFKDEVLFNMSETSIATSDLGVPSRTTSPGLHDLPRTANLAQRLTSTSREGSPRTSSPLQRSLLGGRPSLTSRGSLSSIASQSPSGSPHGHGRPRITREEVKRRMLQGPRASASPMLRKEVYLTEQERQDSFEVEVESAGLLVAEEFDKSLPLEPESSTDASLIQEPAELDTSGDKDTVSVMTSELSTETAIVDVAERKDFGSLDAPRSLNSDVGSIRSVRSVRTTHSVQSGVEFGLKAPSSGFNLNFDFGSKFGLGGLGIEGLAGGTTASRGSTQTIMRSATSDATPAPPMPGSPAAMEIHDVDVEMRSALDRLMEDVGGAGGMGGDEPGMDDSFVTATDDADSSMEEPSVSARGPNAMQRAATDSVLLPGPGGGFVPSSRNTSSSSALPPPVPPKDNIRSREELILEKRREARRRDEGDEEEVLGSGSPAQPSRYLAAPGGRPSRRRSMSTGDAEQIRGSVKKRGRAESTDPVMLNIGGLEDALTDSIEQELKKLVGPTGKYQVKEREEMIYATSDMDRVSHMAGPGDMNAGKAWRTVRRPSDMNEYSKQIKEYRSRDTSTRAFGRVFVKVVKLSGLLIPLPDQPTALTCTINNGKEFVTAPPCLLELDSNIQQEFELAEINENMEILLTFKVRRDAHIIAQFKALSAPPAAPPPPPPVVAQSSSKGGVLSFFHSSPKKSKEKKPSPPPPPPPQLPRRLPENLARYLKTDGTLGRALIAFKAISHRCDSRIFETSYPVIGQRLELGNKLTSVQVGEITLQMFRLPPLPGIHQDKLPRSIDECRAGLRHLNWHKVTYLQGVLTQTGGDCNSWRRRQFRIIGSNLVAFNDVTKKATVTIDLKRAIAVEDDQEARNELLSSSSGMASPSARFTDDYDLLGGVERSFRLIFPGREEIVFFADTDEEKAQWLDILRAMVGHVPPHPLWAELLWQRQEDLAKRAAAPSASGFAS